MDKDIGRRVKQLRESSGLTQEELGAALGVKKAAVQKIESGRASISVDKIVVLCGVFRVLPSALLFDDFRDVMKVAFGANLDAGDSCIEDIEGICRINTMVEDRFGPKGVELIRAMDSLNEKGKRRAIAYVDDLARIDEYRRDRQPEVG